MKQGLPMVAGPGTRLFILGSLPGDRSIAEARYYAHPGNHFWRLMGALLDEPLPQMAYEDRLDRLQVHGVGLWDVFDAADREGSADAAIRAARRNALDVLGGDFPDLEAIAFNGAAAAREGRKSLADSGAVVLYDLPSSSARNAMRFEVKLDSWRRLLPHLGRPLHGGAQPAGRSE